MVSQRYLNVQGVVAPVEAGYANRPSTDRGGETLFGVARVPWPQWRGWGKVDYYAAHLGRGSKAFLGAVNNDTELYDMASELFYEEFFCKMRGDDLPEEVCLCVYDMAINSGPSRANKTIQKAVNSLGGPQSTRGILSDEQCAWIADVCASDSRNAFLEAILNKRRKFYWELVDKYPQNQANINGWLNRLRHIAMVVLQYTPDFLSTNER